MDPVTFTKLYKAEILDKLDPMTVIRQMGGDNFIMLCWEKPGDFCHRRVVAGWLRKHTGVLVDEFMPSRKSHADWLREMQGAGKL
jgi:uncharacterized protein (DUF488 family)